MDKICVIYDEDEVYAKRLMGILTESNMISAAVWLFTDKEKLMENIVKNGHDIEFVIIGQDKDINDIKEIFDKKIIVLVEEDLTQDYQIISENVTALYKYQSCYELVKKIMICVGYNNSNDYSNVKLIGVYSLDLDEQKTLFSLNMAKAYAVNKRVLYINLDEFSGLKQLLPDTSGMTLSDALYYYRLNKENVGERILAGISTKNGVDYLPPVINAEDITYIDTGQIMGFIQKLAKAGRYDVVVLDISQAIKQQWRMICECSKIYMITNGSYLSEKRMQDFELYFIQAGMENVLKSIQTVKLQKDIGRLNENFWRTQETEPMYKLVEELIFPEANKRAV